MKGSSEYQIPIFISSTEYNLVDLRAELSRFLNELGYRPILSSADGFPDNSPTMEPWESCLPVLEKSFVVILIIDGRYGTKFEWPNFEALIEKRKVSPTHGEYLLAHKLRKRMLVFIRKEVLTFYQGYKEACKKCKTEEEVKETLAKSLPDHISFETLKFVEEVKTTKPIPWIKEFDDVTSLKTEVQKKMLNQLAEIFLIKEQHLDTVIKVFNQAMEELSPEKQKEILQKINATKELREAKEELDNKEKELQKIKTELETEKKGNESDKKSKEKK